MLVGRGMLRTFNVPQFTWREVVAYSPDRIGVAFLPQSGASTVVVAGPEPGSDLATSGPGTDVIRGVILTTSQWLELGGQIARGPFWASDVGGVVLLSVIEIFPEGYVRGEPTEGVKD